MSTENFRGKAKLRSGLASLLMIALAGAAFGCGDEEETVVQQTEMKSEAERPPPREGPEGCYIGPQMRCDCAIIEADCTEDVGLWTAGCASCAAP